MCIRDRWITRKLAEMYLGADGLPIHNPNSTVGVNYSSPQQRSEERRVGKALQAGKDVVSAVTLSDADIANMSKEYMVWMDAHNPLTKPDTRCV